MRKYLQLLLLFLTLIVILNSCEDQKFGRDNNNKFFNYITIDGKIFKDGKKDFYPMGINYSVDVVKNDEKVFLTPRSNYHPKFGEDEGESFSTWGEDSAKTHAIIKSHFISIKDMGFNMIRLTGFTTTDGYDGGFHTWSKLDVSNSEEGNKNIEQKIIPLLKMLLKYAEEANLRVMFLISAIETQPENQLNYYSKIAAALKNEKALFAYDLYNEPIYFDKGNYTKKETTEFVKSYNKAIKNNAPNHLTTIGLSHYKIVNEWDPELMDVDFLAFHIYPYGSKNLSILERFEAKLYWISNTISKPWIIGETGLNTAENCEPLNFSWGNYNDQLYFMKYSLEKTKESGGSGYTWWNFQDTKNYPGQIFGTCTVSDYGLVNRKENTFYLNSNGDTILGELKHQLTDLPFKKFTNKNPYNKWWWENKIEKVDSVYYNIDYIPDNESAYGKVVNENNKPVENAIVTLHNTISKATYTTFTKKDGTFKLSTGWTNVFNHLDFKIKVTAVRMETKEIPLKEIYKGKGNTFETIQLEIFN